MKIRSVCLSLLVILLVDVRAASQSQIAGPMGTPMYVPGIGTGGSMSRGSTSGGSMSRGTTSGGSMSKSTTSGGSMSRGSTSGGSKSRSTTGSGSMRKAPTTSGSSAKGQTEAGTSRKSTTGKSTSQKQQTTADRQNVQQRETETKQMQPTSGNSQVEPQSGKEKKAFKPSGTTMNMVNPYVRGKNSIWPRHRIHMKKVVSGMSFSTGGFGNIAVEPNPKSNYDSSKGERFLQNGNIPLEEKKANASYVKIQGIFGGKGMFVFNGRELIYEYLGGKLPKDVFVNDEYWEDLSVPLKLNRNYSFKRHCQVYKKVGAGSVDAFKKDNKYAVGVDDSAFDGEHEYRIVVRFE